MCVCSGCLKKNEVNPRVFFLFEWRIITRPSYLCLRKPHYIYMISLFIVEGRGVSPYGGIDPFKYLTLWLYSTLKVLIDWIFNTLNQILGDVLWR